MTVCYFRQVKTMTNRMAVMVLVTAIGFVLVACSSTSDDVPSFDTGAGQQADPTAVVEEEPLGDEAKMMAFTQCMRDQGIELLDAGVDAEGNVQRPVLAEGAQVSEENYQAAMKVCGKHL
jgi:hypothetical protein